MNLQKRKARAKQKKKLHNITKFRDRTKIEHRSSIQRSPYVPIRSNRSPYRRQA